ALLRQPGAWRTPSIDEVNGVTDGVAGDRLRNRDTALNELVNASAGFVSGQVSASTKDAANPAFRGMRDAPARSWDSLIPAGGRFLTPWGARKPLGAGVVEQKQVRDQSLATSTQRYLENYANVHD